MENQETPKSKKKRVEPKNTAFGLVQEQNSFAENGDILIGKWNLVKIKFDLASGEVGDVSTTEMEDLGYAMERIQVELETEIAMKEQG